MRSLSEEDNLYINLRTVKVENQELRKNRTCSVFCERLIIGRGPLI